MTHDACIREAIVAAKSSEERGGGAIGAVVVDSKGQIVGTGMSLVSPINDITSHAEVEAIRDAGSKLKTIDLDGCVLYSTLEPCGMCLSAALWGNMSAVYFGAYAEDVSPKNQYEYSAYSSEELASRSKRWDGSQITVKGGFLRSECKELLSSYVNWEKKPL